jgi:hypothetical protein
LDGDPALVKIGALIHYLDVGGVPAAEAAGIEALLCGARTALSDDDRLMYEAGKVFGTAGRIQQGLVCKVMVFTIA